MASIATQALSVSRQKLPDVGAAFRRVPKTGAPVSYAGSFNRAGANTHIQGAIVLPGYYVLSYSNEASDRGVLLVLKTSGNQLTQAVPVPNDYKRPLYHAGGIQRLGDVIAVPSEAQDGFSVVIFINAQALVDKGAVKQIVKPIVRQTNDAMAVGITDITSGGRTMWVAGVFQKGCIDFYVHDALLDPNTDWQDPVPLRVDQQEHQAFLLFAETPLIDGADDRLYAIGLNHGNWIYEHRATLYRVTLVEGKPSAITIVESREDFDFKSGATLRYGGGIDVIGSEFQLYGTSKFFERRCVIERFGPDTVGPAADVPRITTVGALAKEEALGIERVPLPPSAPDLRDGVVIVLSGGPFDAMNPPEVLDHMERLISDLNADPWVQERTAGVGLRYKLLPDQVSRHLHQAQWRLLRDKLKTLTPKPLIIVGHSNGGAAAVDLAKMLADDDRTVDLLITADSVATVDDVGDINEIPPNVCLNLNSYVVPTPAWLLAPFPIGRRNRRHAGAQATTLVNVGLAYDLPGAVAHRNAFYDLAGGDFRNGSFAYPDLILDLMLATLRGTPDAAIVGAVATELQVLADRARVVIELESRQLTRTIRTGSTDVIVERVQASPPETADAAATTLERSRGPKSRVVRSGRRKTRPSNRHRTK